MEKGEAQTEGQTEGQSRDGSPASLKAVEARVLKAKVTTGSRGLVESGVVGNTPDSILTSPASSLHRAESLESWDQSGDFLPEAPSVDNNISRPLRSLGSRNLGVSRGFPKFLGAEKSPLCRPCGVTFFRKRQRYNGAVTEPAAEGQEALRWGTQKCCVTLDKSPSLSGPPPCAQTLW